MFSGLVQEKGIIKEIISKDVNSIGLKIQANEVLKDAKIGDSICVSGVCLTVVKIEDNTFFADVMHETLNKTILKYLKENDEVNLEKSLTLQDYLGGHLVYGDVDYVTQITKIEEDGFAKIYYFKQDPKFDKYFVKKGRVTIDGTSLTLVSCNESEFSVSLIPHTLKSVVLGNKTLGDFVNIEPDIIAKHLEKLSRSKND